METIRVTRPSSPIRWTRCRLRTHIPSNSRLSERVAAPAWGAELFGANSLTPQPGARSTTLANTSLRWRTRSQIRTAPEQKWDSNPLRRSNLARTRSTVIPSHFRRAEARANPRPVGTRITGRSQWSQMRHW